MCPVNKLTISPSKVSSDLIFDCALEICYDILAKDFIKFKKTDFYDELKDKFIDDSIIKSKMINLNLIQGF